jgi:hypothetical protein
VFAIFGYDVKRNASFEWEFFSGGVELVKYCVLLAGHERNYGGETTGACGAKVTDFDCNERR